MQTGPDLEQLRASKHARLRDLNILLTHGSSMRSERYYAALLNPSSKIFAIFYTVVTLLSSDFGTSRQSFLCTYSLPERQLQC